MKRKKNEEKKRFDWPSPLHSPPNVPLARSSLPRDAIPLPSLVFLDHSSPLPQSAPQPPLVSLPQSPFPPSLCALLTLRRWREHCAGAGGGRGAAGAGAGRCAAAAASGGRTRRAPSRTAAEAARWGLFPLHSSPPSLPLAAF
jgi:hypothetical protein